MITEDYVSFEIAKLLKEKGFDEVCFRYAESKEIYESGDWYVGNVTGGCIGVPTLQMAMKWLRETFEIHCQIDCPIAASNWMYGIRDLNKDEWVTLRNMGDYDTYEEACETAIKYCLENLI